MHSGLDCHVKLHQVYQVCIDINLEFKNIGVQGDVLRATKIVGGCLTKRVRAARNHC